MSNLDIRGNTPHSGRSAEIIFGKIDVPERQREQIDEIF